jgi:metal-responsive CopG/Arc/MetJ family transcriptional regulator
MGKRPILSVALSQKDADRLNEIARAEKVSRSDLLRAMVLSGIKMYDDLQEAIELAAHQEAEKASKKK